MVAVASTAALRESPPSALLSLKLLVVYEKVIIDNYLPTDPSLLNCLDPLSASLSLLNCLDPLSASLGYYTGLGNRGLRHHGKKIQLKSYEGDRQNTVIDCQHAPDGFILNNNKDSESPFAGYVDTQDILTKNCENLRIYDI